MLLLAPILLVWLMSSYLSPVNRIQGLLKSSLSDQEENSSCRSNLGYANCIPCKVVRPPKKYYSEYDTEQRLWMRLLFWNMDYPFIAITPRSTLIRSNITS